MKNNRPETIDQAQQPPADVKQDWVLETYVRIANEHGHQIGLTLHVGGLIVTGVLIGWREYLLGTTQNELGAFDDPAELEAFKETLGEPTQPEEDDSSDDEGPSPVHFIHLKDARVYSPSGMLPHNRGTYWRGRLTSVDGFILGALSAD